MNATVSLSVENESADAGRDGLTCLSRLISRARTGTEKNNFPCLADHKQYTFDAQSAERHDQLQQDFFPHVWDVEKV